MWPVEPGDLSPMGNRLDHHRGGLEERYVNSPRGLEQGFVLPAPPQDMARLLGVKAVDGPALVSRNTRGIDPQTLIHLDLDLSGGLVPVIAADGQAVDFALPGGATVVHHAELSATGAAGTVLPAWMEGYAGDTMRGIRLVVDTDDAIYPITIDPLATSPAWTAESNQVLSLSLTGSDGTQVTLSVPPGAILGGEDVSLTWVTDLQGLFLGQGMQAAVRMAPQGMRLLQPASRSRAWNPRPQMGIYRRTVA